MTGTDSHVVHEKTVIYGSKYIKTCQLTTVLLICLLATTVSSQTEGLVFKSNAFQNLTETCPQGSFWHAGVYGFNRDWYFRIHCDTEPLVGTENCAWSEFSSYGQGFDFECNGQDTSINGIVSEYNGQDRRYRFYCCKIQGMRGTKNCEVLDEAFGLDDQVVKQVTWSVTDSGTDLKLTGCDMVF